MRYALAFLLLVPLAAHADVASKRAALHEMLRLIDADVPDDSKAFLAFDRNLTEQDARDAIAFFRGAAGQHFLSASRDASNANLRRLQDAIDTSNRKRTNADLRTIAVAVEAYQLDHQKYPVAKDLDELAALLVPAYVRVMPRIDGWGHEYVYSSDGATFQLLSRGSDGKLGTADDISAPEP